MSALTTSEAYELDRMNALAFKYGLGARIKVLEEFMETLDTPAELTGVLLTGFVSGAGTVADTDTILEAINKLDGNEIASAAVAAAALPSASFTAAAVTGKLITGFVSGAGTVAATDTILEAINKLDGNNLALTNNTASLVGAIAAQPVSGSTAVTIERFGKFFVLTFTLTAAQIPVTDDGASGSFGSLQLFDFVQQGIAILGVRQNYTAFAEGAALTGAVGDAVFEIGVGSTAIAAAADGALGATEDDVGGDVNITNSGGTGAGTGYNGAGAVFDGTTTANDLYLNFSGTAATIDANSTLDVTGTITVVGCLLGDD